MSERSVVQKYGLVFMLSCVAVIMVMIKLSYRDKDWGKELTVNIPSPTPTIMAVPTRISKIIEDYALWQELPYEGKGFVIDRYVDKKTIVVQAKGVDRKIIEGEVWNWFEENNVATEGMKIKWE